MNIKKDKFLNYLILIRPSNWIKNFIIFLPIFFGGKISEISLIENTIIAFISFSFLASSIYVLNDYMDLAYDRSHPLKNIDLWPLVRYL